MAYGNGIGLKRTSLFWSLMTAIAILAAVFAYSGTAEAQTPSGSISGKVTEDDGTTPVVGAVIFVSDFTTGAAVGNATSTASGTYTVSTLGTGTYRVHVNAKDQGYGIEYSSNVADADSATAVSVTDTVDTPNIDFTLSSGGSISGTVFQTNGTTPITNADVWAEDFGGSGEGNGTRTDGSGNYTIGGLPAGSYRVVSASADQGYSHEFYNNTADFDSATSVAVTSDNTTTSINFTLASGGSISGTVTIDGGGNAANVEVWANSYDGTGGGNGATTAGDGTYTITGLTAGDYRVEVFADDQGYSNEFYNDTMDWSLAARVSVTAGATTSGISFSLASGGTIAGTVIRDSDSSKVENAWVWAEAYDCCGGNGAQTDSNGDYSIAGLKAGDYRVRVESSDAGLASEFYNNQQDWSLANRVAVTASSTTASIDFSLASGGSISGTVFQADGTTPLGDAWVWAEDYNCCGGNGSQTASDGTYTITGLAAGNYRVQVYADDQGYASEFYNDKTDWALADSVAVTSGNTTSSINFTLATGGSISGTVYQSDGTTPLANADVWADTYDCCGGGSGTQTATDGTYTITGLGAGDYRVQVFVPGSSFAGEFYNNTTNWDQAARVAVTASQTTTGIDFTLNAGGSISGTVYESDGTTPLADADVWAESYDCCGGNGTRTAADGTYTISGLTPGDYRVQVNVFGASFAGEFYNNTTDWDSAARVTVTASTTTSNIDFTLDAGGSISGTVYEGDGTTPLANVDVWANTYDCCGGGNGSRTASDGTYTITGLAPDDYRVEVFANGQAFASEFYNNTKDWFLAGRVTVTAGNTTSSIDFSLDAGGSISGTVTKTSDSSAVVNAWVWAETYDCCGGNGAQTDSNGDYTISGLASGNYRVQVWPDGQALASEFYNDTQDWSLAAQVSVTSGLTTTGIDFGLDGGGAISGTVTKDSDSSPVAGVDVWANAYTCCGGGGARTASDGTFTIQGLPAGNYRVEVYVNDPTSGLAGEFYNNKTNWDEATSVVVTSSQTTANIDFGLASGGSISGTVFEGDGTTPIPDANVWSSSYDSNGGWGWARTAADGTYTMNGLTPGNYRVEAEANGQVHELYNNTTRWDLASPVAVTASTDTPNIDFSLDSGGTVTGTVYLQDGTTPVAGAEISASSYNGTGGWGWAQSASDGTFTITGLSTGNYRLQAGKPQAGLTYVFYNAQTSWENATQVSVTSGATTASIDFSLGSGGTISGTVFEDDGVTAIANAWVWADSYDCCSGGNGTNTDASGNYTIQGLGAGDYRVQVYAFEQGYTTEFYNNTNSWDQANRVTVVASQTTSGINFTLGSGGSISGKATLGDGTTPVINAWVWAETFECCNGGNGGQTDSNGNYTITGLVPGSYRVQISAWEQGLTTQFYNNTTDWNAATSVSVQSGGTTANINFTMATGGSISGSIMESDGTTPVANAWVWADSYDCCSGGNGASTDANGDYTISGLGADDYRVQVNPEPGQGLISEFYDDTTDWGMAARVSVTASVDTPNINFQLGSGGSVSGTVTADVGGAPVANAWVWAETFNCCGGNGAPTNADGTFLISGLAPGDYRIGVHIDDSSAGLAGEYYMDSDWNGADSVSVTAGATTPNIDFGLAAGGSISGVITRDSDGTAVAGADVWADSIVCCGGGGTRSNFDGTFTISGLAANSYIVRGQAPEQGLAGEFYNNVFSFDLGTPIVVSAGQDSAGINISLGAGSSIFGTVFQADGVTAIPNAQVFAFSPDDDEEEFFSMANTSGQYEIIGLSPGSYAVAAMADGFAVELYGGGINIASSTLVAITSGVDALGIDFQLDPGGSISGTVYETDGTTPIGFVEVVALPEGTPFPPDDEFFFEEAAIDGTYEIAGLPAGNYMVYAIGSDFGYVFEFYSNTVDPSALTPVTVTSGNDTSGIDFTLADGGSISGTIFRTDGTTPISDMLIIAVDVSTGFTMSDADTEMNGTYVIDGLPAGNYLVYTEDDFDQGYVDEYYDGVSGAGSATQVTVSGTSDTPNIDFTLESQ